MPNLQRKTALIASAVMAIVISLMPLAVTAGAKPLTLTEHSEHVGSSSPHPDCHAAMVACCAVHCLSNLPATLPDFVNMGQRGFAQPGPETFVLSAFHRRLDRPPKVT